MPSVEFPQRLIFDSNFFEKVLKPSSMTTERPPMIMKLIHINAKAKGYKRQYNCMSAKVFNEILKQGVPRDTLRAAFYPLNEPEVIEQIEDEIVRTVKHAIELSSNYKPYSTIIMTSSDTKEMYANNHDFNTTPLVTVLCGNDCKEIIDTFFRRVERT